MHFASMINKFSDLEIFALQGGNGMGKVKNSVHKLIRKWALYIIC